MKIYSEMKDSSAKGIGKIPKHWKLKKIKQIVDQNRRVTYGIVQPGNYDRDGIILIRGQDYIKGWTKLDKFFKVGKKLHHDFIRARTKPGDILMCIVGDVGSINQVPEWIKEANITQTTARIACNENIVNSRFAFYFLNSHVGKTQAENFAKGAVQKGLNLSMVENFYIPVAPIKEQTKIVEFLEKNMSRIKMELERNQKLIKLLKEKKQSLMNQAVTKGLDSSIPMKDSGVEWIGKIPKHWEIKTLKKIIKNGSSITYGIVQAGDHIEDGIPYIRTGDMYYETFPREGYLKTSSEIDSKFKRSKVYEGNIVVAIRATVGKAMIVPDFLDGANLTQGTAKIAPNKEMDNKFVLFAINSESSQQRFNAIMKGATFKEITLEMLRNFIITCPPLNEQKEISNFIDKKTSNIDSLIHKTTTHIEKLQEYRQSLISSAVTGKIDVRDAVA